MKRSSLRNNGKSSIRAGRQTGSGGGSKWGWGPSPMRTLRTAMPKSGWDANCASWCSACLIDSCEYRCRSDVYTEDSMERCRRSSSRSDMRSTSNGPPDGDKPVEATLSARRWLSERPLPRQPCFWTPDRTASFRLSAPQSHATHRSAIQRSTDVCSLIQSRRCRKASRGCDILQLLEVSNVAHALLLDALRTGAVTSGCLPY